MQLAEILMRLSDIDDDLASFTPCAETRRIAEHVAVIRQAVMSALTDLRERAKPSASTPGRLRVIGDSTRGGTFDLHADGTGKVLARGVPALDDAKRLAAAWNAVEGISTGALEDTTLVTMTQGERLDQLSELARELAKRPGEVG